MFSDTELQDIEHSLEQDLIKFWCDLQRALSYELTDRAAQIETEIRNTEDMLGMVRWMRSLNNLLSTAR